jgi:hypothetical protein
LALGRLALGGRLVGDLELDLGRRRGGQACAQQRCGQKARRMAMDESSRGSAADRAGESGK